MPLRLEVTVIHYQAWKVKAYMALFTFSHQVLNMSINIVLRNIHSKTRRKKKTCNLECNLPKVTSSSVLSKK